MYERRESINLSDIFGFVVMKPGPTVELRRLNSLLCANERRGNREKSWAESEHA